MTVRELLTALETLALQEDVALHSHRHFLAALKHGSTLSSVSIDEWPKMLCSNDDYIEAIFIADVDLN